MAGLHLSLASECLELRENETENVHGLLRLVWMLTHYASLILLSHAHAWKPCGLVHETMWIDISQGFVSEEEGTYVLEKEIHPLNIDVGFPSVCYEYV